MIWFSWHFGFWGSAPWVPVWEYSSACVCVCYHDYMNDFSPLTNRLTHFMAFYFQHLRGPLCMTTETEARSSRARRPVVRVKKNIFFSKGIVWTHKHQHRSRLFSSCHCLLHMLPGPLTGKDAHMLSSRNNNTHISYIHELLCCSDSFVSV